MKLPGFCPVCPKDAEGRVNPIFAEMTDDNIIEVKCPRGHVTHTAIQVPRFELLFESGALALVDGYPREAISAFAVSVERFHEHWIRATLLEAGRTPEAIDTFWKPIARQSERQYGAFLALYFNERQVPASPIAEKWVDLRNRITHKGYWPTTEEARTYGHAMIEYVAPLLRELKERSPQGTLLAMAAQVIAAHRSVPPRRATAPNRPTSGFSTALGRAADRGTVEASFFDEHLRGLAAHRGVFGR